MAQQPNQGILPLPPPLPAQVAAAPAAGRGRGNRRRGGGGRPRNDPNVRPPRIPNLQPPNGAPRPAHLATTSTPERNDPLWTTGLPGAELQPVPNIEYIQSSAEFLPHVTSVIHATCVATSPGYSRRVPESALAYYCAVTTYYRMLRLHIGNGLAASTDEARFVEQVDSLQLEAPMLLAHYLSGFGNTRVPSGRDIRFRMATRPEYTTVDGVSGWFGRVSSQTQPFYQNYPCLAVYINRIWSDMDANADRNWNLPMALRPNLEGGVGPSRALLGFVPKVNIPASQIAFLNACDVAVGEPFVSANPTLPLNIALLLSIQQELKQVSSMKFTPLPTSIVGSQAQLGFVRYEDEIVVTAVKTAVLESHYQMPSEISFVASAFGYRVKHDIDSVDPETQIAPWEIWRHAAHNRWNAYIAAGNNFRADEPDLLKIAEFRTTPYLVVSRLEALERAMLSRAS